MEQHGWSVETDGAQGPVGRAAREVERNTPLRQARVCYSHLAGVAGVRLLDEMLRRGWLAQTLDTKVPAATVQAATTRIEYELTPLGAHALAERGVDLSAAARPGRRLAYGCPDWTEGRPHLAGALGEAVLRCLERSGVIHESDGTRVVRQDASLVSWLDGPRELRA